MHIAQIAPPWFPVPPVGYGGIERVIYDLTEGLLQNGQEVTLFAPAGSTTNEAQVQIGAPWAPALYPAGRPATILG